MDLSKKVIHGVTGCFIVATKDSQQPQDAYLGMEVGLSEQIDYKIFWYTELAKTERIHLCVYLKKERKRDSFRNCRHEKTK